MAKDWCLTWKCRKCGATGTSKVGPGLFEVECPKCGEMDDVEVKFGN